MTRRRRRRRRRRRIPTTRDAPGYAGHLKKVIFEIIEVVACNPPAIQYSRVVLICLDFG